MDQSLLTSRAIRGMYFARLEANPALAVIGQISNEFSSDQASETYNFLGQTPAMRAWVGERQAKGFRGDGITILNTHYEATVEVRKADIRRDKTPQTRARMAELADRGQTHWMSLLSTLIANGPSEVCYDGQFFFDTDHSEGDSGTQDNDITVDISAQPSQVAGTTTAPSKEEMQWAILKAISQIISFVDDRNEPMNEGARDFLVLVPIGLWPAALAAVSPMVNSGMAASVDPTGLSKFNVSIELDARSAWTDSFSVFRTDSPMKAFIRQKETDIEFAAKAEGSEFEFDNAAWQFGIDAWRGAGYGYWQRACYVTMI